MDYMQGVSLSNLKKGSRGADVRLAQVLLNYKGFDCGSVDGIYGSKTEKAVMEFTNYKTNEINFDVWYKLLSNL